MPSDFKYSDRKYNRDRYNRLIDLKGVTLFKYLKNIGSKIFMRIVGALHIDGDLTVGGNDIKDFSKNTVLSFDGTGGVDKIGDDTPSSGEFLKWNGSKAVWDAVSASVSDLHSAGVDGAANQLLTDNGDGTVTSESTLTYSPGLLQWGDADDSFNIIARYSNASGDGGASWFVGGQGAGTDADGGSLKIIAGNSTGTGTTFIDFNMGRPAASTGSGINTYLANTHSRMIATNTTNDTYFYEGPNSTLVDYFKISVAEHGATTLSTVDAAAEAADLTFTIDGETTFQSDGVEVNNDSLSGRPALKVVNHDIDQIALDIDASNTTGDIIDIYSSALTTGKVIDIDCNSLTTGSAINIDVDDALTTTASKSLIKIDYDKAGVTAGSQTSTTVGLDIDMADAATNNASGDVRMTGVKVNIDNANAQGSIQPKGILLQVAADGVGDAASSYGIDMEVIDGGTDIICRSHADVADYFSIATTTSGATTLTTEDGGGEVAHLTLDADGEITIDTHARGAYAGINLATQGQDFANFGFHHSASWFYLWENGGASESDFFSIDCAANGASTIQTYDAAGTDADLTIISGGYLSLRAATNKISKTYDFHTTPFENTYSDDEGSGTILKYSPGADESPAGSTLYFLHTDGTWNTTLADAVATGASQLLGVGLGASARTTGVLLEGFVAIAYAEILNIPGSGAVDGLPVYVSDTTAGHFDFNAPSDTDDYVRIVGYAIDGHDEDGDDDEKILIYFKPDNTWVEIA